MNLVEKKERLEKAISHLMSIGMIEGGAVATSIAEKMKRGMESVSAARNGHERYLTEKFVKAFCAAYNNIISYDWIWNGKGEMLSSNNTPNATDIPHISIPDDIENMEKPQLLSLLACMVDTYNKILDNNKILHEHLRVCEEIARRDQENFKYLISQITKYV